MPNNAREEGSGITYVSTLTPEAAATQLPPLKDRQGDLIKRLFVRKEAGEHAGQQHSGLQYAMDECIDLEEKYLSALQRLSQVESVANAVQKGMTDNLHNGLYDGFTIAEWISKATQAEKERDALQAKLDAILKLVEGGLPPLDERQYLELKAAIREAVKS